MQPFLLFTIDQQHFGLDLTYVERILWAMAVTPIPTPHPALLGMINVHEQMIPVLNMRHVFGQKERDLELNDQFIICKYGAKSMALWVDHVRDVTSLAQEELTQTEPLLPYAQLIQAIAYDKQQMVFILELAPILQVWDSSIQVSK